MKISTRTRTRTKPMRTTRTRANVSWPICKTNAFVMPFWPDRAAPGIDRLCLKDIWPGSWRDDVDGGLLLSCTTNLCCCLGLENRKQLIYCFRKLDQQQCLYFHWMFIFMSSLNYNSRTQDTEYILACANSSTNTMKVPLFALQRHFKGNSTGLPRNFDITSVVQKRKIIRKKIVLLSFLLQT